MRGRTAVLFMSAALGILAAMPAEGTAAVTPALPGWFQTAIAGTGCGFQDLGPRPAEPPIRPAYDNVQVLPAGGAFDDADIVWNDYATGATCQRALGQGFTVKCSARYTDVQNFPGDPPNYPNTSLKAGCNIQGPNVQQICTGGYETNEVSAGGTTFQDTSPLFDSFLTCFADPPSAFKEYLCSLQQNKQAGSSPAGDPSALTAKKKRKRKAKKPAQGQKCPAGQAKKKKKKRKGKRRRI